MMGQCVATDVHTVNDSVTVREVVSDKVVITDGSNEVVISSSTQEVTTTATKDIVVVS